MDHFAIKLAFGSKRSRVSSAYPQDGAALDLTSVSLMRSIRRYFPQINNALNRTPNAKLMLMETSATMSFR